MLPIILHFVKKSLEFLEKIFDFCLFLFVLDDCVMRSKKKSETFIYNGYLCLRIF